MEMETNVPDIEEKKIQDNLKKLSILMKIGSLLIERD
jgi:hypothetical protein